MYPFSGKFVVNRKLIFIDYFKMSNIEEIIRLTASELIGSVVMIQGVQQNMSHSNSQEASHFTFHDRSIMSAQWCSDIIPASRAGGAGF